MLTSLNTTEEVRKQRPRMAILPVGATERHGPHLPLATDSIQIETVAHGVAKRLDAYCLPVLPFSISHMHRGCPGGVWLRNETLAAVVRDIAVSVRHDGFKEFVILNGHGGNLVLVAVVQDLNLDFSDLLCVTLDAWLCVANSGIFKDVSEVMHADEFESSCVLHLRPDAVRKSRLPRKRNEPDREMLRYLPLPKFSRATYTGTPSRADTQKGRRAVEFMIENAAKSIQATLKKVAKARNKA